MSAGALLKDAGIARVLNCQSDAWRSTAAALVLVYMQRNGPCLLEAARAFCERACLPPPTHPNAWGALACHLSTTGAIVMTGAWQASSDPRSHARLQPLWRCK